MNRNTAIFIGVCVVIIIFAILYYLYQNNSYPSPPPQEPYVNNLPIPIAPNRLANPGFVDNRRPDDLSDNIVDEYADENQPENGGRSSFSPCDPMANDYGSFDDYVTKKQINMKKMEQPYSNDEYDPRDFSHKKKNYTKRTPDDVADQFDVWAMLPHDTNEDWFDTVPLQTTKKIAGDRLLHPKVHMGVNTIGNSHRNGTHDLRGDIPNPKINVAPWNQSTIEPDTNIRGICNPM